MCGAKLPLWADIIYGGARSSGKGAQIQLYISLCPNYLLELLLSVGTCVFVLFPNTQQVEAP